MDQKVDAGVRVNEKDFVGGHLLPLEFREADGDDVVGDMYLGECAFVTWSTDGRH